MGHYPAGINSLPFPAIRTSPCHLLLLYLSFPQALMKLPLNLITSRGGALWPMNLHLCAWLTFNDRALCLCAAHLFIYFKPVLLGIWSFICHQNVTPAGRKGTWLQLLKNTVDNTCTENLIGVIDATLHGCHCRKSQTTDRNGWLRERLSEVLIQLQSLKNVWFFFPLILCD